MAGLLSRIFRPSAVKAAEGQYRDGPWYLPITGGWLSHNAGQYVNWWQNGHDVVRGSSGAMVEACVGAYSQTVAMCPGDHWRGEENGGRKRVMNSAVSRLLRKPNAYQSISDFLLNATRSLYMQGNTYALALRNDRFEIEQLHLMNPSQCSARVAETGDMFYQLGGNDVVDRMFAEGGRRADLVVPARDVLHIKLHTPNNPLLGETPLQAAAPDILASQAMTSQQIAFYLNQARPSFVLTTDHELTSEQVDMLREKWNAQSQGMAQGGTPILSAGLKPQFMSTSNKDAELAAIMKLSDEHVSLVFRVPMQILGLGSTPFASTEALMNSWISSGLGFTLNHIEDAIGRLFNLKGLPDEYVEFDTSVLLRSAVKDRVDALAASIKGGVRTINEARREESLPEVDGGDEIRIQQQDVPLDWWEKEQAAKDKAATAAAAAKPQLPAPAPAPALPAPAKDFPNADSIRSRFRSSLARHAV